MCRFKIPLYYCEWGPDEFEDLHHHFSEKAIFTTRCNTARSRNKDCKRDLREPLRAERERHCLNLHECCEALIVELLERWGQHRRDLKAKRKAEVEAMAKDKDNKDQDRDKYEQYDDESAALGQVAFDAAKTHQHRCEYPLEEHFPQARKKIIQLYDLVDFKSAQKPYGWVW